MTTNDKKFSTKGIRKWFLKNLLYLIIIGTILFLTSGKPDWLMAWVYLALVVAIVIVNAIVLDTQLLVERSELQKETKKWDVFLASFVAVWGPLCIFLVGGLDIRFGWSQGIGIMLQFLALLFFGLGSLITTWAMVSNQFFSGTVRIQSNRGHSVVSKGPYQYVRHPGYSGAITAMVMTPVALGSWVALIPGILVAWVILFERAWKIGY